MNLPDICMIGIGLSQDPYRGRHHNTTRRRPDKDSNPYVEGSKPLRALHRAATELGQNRFLSSVESERGGGWGWGTKDTWA